MKEKEFIISCSKISDIMTKPKNASELISDGAKTVVTEWYNNQYFNRKPLPAGSKYTIKGTEQEWVALAFLNNHIGSRYAKNKEYKNDGTISGFADVVECNHIAEIKCPFTHETFPTLHNDLYSFKKEYWCQVQGYMHLWGKSSAKVFFVLVNAPENVINSEMWRIARLNGYPSPSADIEAKVRATLTFDDLPNDKRVKCFDVEYSPDFIEVVKERVLMCREWLEIKKGGAPW